MVKSRLLYLGSEIRNHKKIGIAAIFLAVAALVAGCGILLPGLAAQNKIPGPHGSIKISCRNCHNATGFKPIRPFPDFDHNRTGFLIGGKHEGLDCRQCHVKLVFSNVGNQCADCHADIHRRQMGSNCEQCHSVRGWRELTKVINGHEDRFPLFGAHKTLQCEDCHRSAAVGLFKGLNTDCSFCHINDYLNSGSVDHVALGYPTNCEMCHSADSWQSGFDHVAATGFPLSGAHAQVDCRQCHIGGNFSGVQPDCASCHLEQYNGATDPNHISAGFSRDCSNCHSTSTWTSVQFSHSNTSFPLTGSHTTLGCSACHGSGQYTTLPTNCDSCHSALFNQSTNPNHVSAGFSRDCSTCHSTSAWTPAQFDHSRTSFPLTGAHTSQTCSGCHGSGQYAALPTACVSCHSNDFNRATDPNHVSAGFPQDCSICHGTSTWTSSTFNHGNTRFPLTGAHVNQTCSACHSNGQYATLPTTCESCHLTQFNQSTNPNHIAAGFPRDCSICHGTSAWTPAKFDHSATSFPLTGAHANQTCSACHSSGQYATLPTTCVSCHLAQYNGAANPNHISTGFPQDCSLCHSTSVWTPSTYNHSNTNFPLTGAHTSVQCSNCHINGVYAGTPKDCFSCHSSEYNNVTDPNHVAAGFPKDCSTCHSTLQWSGATFTHSLFPIYSGRHAGTWTACSDCHSNASNYSVFSCLTCHAHAQATADSQHRGISNYVYNSANCYSCHPTGRAEN
jgi:hypothetical protein